MENIKEVVHKQDKPDSVAFKQTAKGFTTYEVKVYGTAINGADIEDIIETAKNLAKDAQKVCNELNTLKAVEK